MAEHEHPTQAVSPGAEPEQSGPAPSGEMVDPEHAAEAEFPPVLDESRDVDVEDEEFKKR